MPIDDVHVLVTFYSRGGLTERIAVWLAEGAVQAGAKIRLRRARDIAPEFSILLNPEWAANRDRMHDEFAAPTEADAAWAHVLAFGIPAPTQQAAPEPLSPGVLSPELGAYLDRLDTTDLNGKIGTGFASSYIPTAGRASALANLEIPMRDLGLTVLPFIQGLTSQALSDWELAHAHGHQVVAVARAMLREMGTGKPSSLQ